MLHIIAIALAAAMARIVSLLLGIFIAAKLYFFQTESREFSSGAESSDLGDFIETLPAFLKFLIPF
jgi:hypothetical protein